MNSAPSASKQEFSLHHLRARGRSHYASWVRFGVGVCIGAYLLSSSIHLVRGNLGPDLALELFVACTALVAFLVARGGRPTLAGIMVLGVVWLELTASVLVAGDLRGTVAYVYPPLVLGTGLFLGSRAAWVMGLLSVSSAYLATVAAGVAGRGPGLTPDMLHALLTFILSVAATAGLVQLGLRAILAVLEESEASKDRYRELVREAPDGIIVLDGEHRIREVNPAGEQLVQASAESLLDRSLREVLPQEGADALAALLDRSGAESVSLPVRFPRAAGRPATLEVTARRIEQGPDRERVQIMLRDISQRVALQEREIQLGRLFSEAGTEILVFDSEDGALLQVSNGALGNLGYPAEEVTGRPVSTVCPNLALEGLHILVERLTDAEGSPIREKGLHRRSDGTVYPVETEYMKASLSGESVVVAFAVDITERTRAEEEQRQLQEQLEHAQKMEAVGHLAGGVAHDFNNLLTVIGGCAEVLQDEAPPELWDLVQEISRAHEQGAVLTRQLLTFARREVAQTQVLGLGDLLAGLKPLLARLVGPRIELQMDVPDDGAILADPGQVEQVVMNLVANARDAMPGGGRITITARREEGDGASGRWVVSVRDDGSGMDEETRARIFEPFFTTKPRGKGTGLGLATVHGIVTQNGGEIQVESAPDWGTRFDIYWPGAEEERDAGATSDCVEAACPGLRILLAEDDAAARRLTKRMLEMDGHQVDVAASGEEAQALLEAGPEAYDLLVTDVVMPGISGIELVERVRAASVHLPALIVSGFLDERLHGAVPGDPHTLLLHKPFRRAELQHHVARVVRPEPSTGEAA